MPPVRTRSKNVLAVLGRMAIDKEFRTMFFNAPEATAAGFVGSLEPFETEQVRDLGGIGPAWSGKDPAPYRANIETALDAVFSICTCPDPPCPGNDS
jgi:hypothetical protein